MLQHGDDAHRKQRRRHQGQGKHETITCACAALAGKIRRTVATRGLVGSFRHGNLAELAVQRIEIKDTENIVHLLRLDADFLGNHRAKVLHRLADANPGEKNHRENQRNIRANPGLARGGGNALLHRHLS